MPIANLLLINFSSAALSAQFEPLSTNLLLLLWVYFREFKGTICPRDYQRCMHYCLFSWAQASLFNVID